MSRRDVAIWVFAVTVGLVVAGLVLALLSALDRDVAISVFPVTVAVVVAGLVVSLLSPRDR